MLLGVMGIVRYSQDDRFFITLMWCSRILSFDAVNVFSFFVCLFLYFFPTNQIKEGSFRSEDSEANIARVSRDPQ